MELFCIFKNIIFIGSILLMAICLNDKYADYVIISPHIAPCCGLVCTLLSEWILYKLRYPRERKLLLTLRNTFFILSILLMNAYLGSKYFGTNVFVLSCFSLVLTILSDLIFYVPHVRETKLLYTLKNVAFLARNTVFIFSILLMNVYLGSEHSENIKSKLYAISLCGLIVSFLLEIMRYACHARKHELLCALRNATIIGSVLLITLYLGGEYSENIKSKFHVISLCGLIATLLLEAIRYARCAKEEEYPESPAV